MSKHTPGPWLIEGRCIHAPNSKGATRFQANISPGFVGEKSKHDDFIGYDEIKANAKLIAAAPDLLEALKAIVSDLNDLYSESTGVTGWHLNGEIATWDELDLPNTIATLEAAIRKAES